MRKIIFIIAILFSAYSFAGQSGYNTPDRDEAVRKSIDPWMVSLYAPTSTPGIVLSQDIENKVNITVVPPATVVPNGFDLYVTAQGASIRYIGSGLGNGDSATFQLTMHMGLTSTTGLATSTFNCITRPYTETEFTNATIIAGCSISRKMQNNDTGSMAIVAPLITLTDGDLVELSINPDSGITVTIKELAVTIVEVN